MNYKNKFLFICLIICLFSIAGVSASDIGPANDNQNNNLMIEDQSVEADDGDTLSVSHENLAEVEEDLVLNEEDSNLKSQNVNDNITQKEDSSTLTRENPEIIIDADSVRVDETAKINITVSNAEGYVIVSVDNQTFNQNLTNHQTMIEVSGLSYGTHNIAVFYGGDDIYLSDFKIATLTVKRIPTQITDIIFSEVSFGEDASIFVFVPDGVKGDITIKLNDTLMTTETERIKDGMAEFTVSNLPTGNYTVNVIYNGNEYYDINDTESAVFEVKKADSELSIVSFEGTVYENGTILMSINYEIIGEFVNVIFDGEQYNNIPIEDGAIVFTTKILTEIKSYPVVVEYAGNDNYESSRIETSVTPKKVTTYGIDISPTNITVNDDEIIVVTVPEHVDDVVVWVGGESYRNHSFTDNKAIFNITGLTEGIYTVTATVNDTEFDHRNYTNIFTVSKVFPMINITLMNETPVCVGDNVKIIVTLPVDTTENVSIIVDGKKYSQKAVDGNATFYIDCLISGDMVIPAIYEGDAKYVLDSTDLYFTVNKVETFLNVSTYIISINDNEEINFTLANDASGNITVFVNNEEYNVAVSGGKGTLVISKLHNGVYYVNATYNGDGKYLTCQNNTEMFNVIINSDQMDIIDEKNNTLVVYLDSTAQGIVTVEIEGKTFNSTVLDGVATVYLTNASLGTHHAYVKFTDNITYETLESVVDVTIPKYISPLSIYSTIMKVGEMAYINVTTPIDASGNVTIELDGESYTAAIDGGIAQFEVIPLFAGDKTLFIKYDGDDTYGENSSSQNLTVYKQESNITVEVKNINVGDIAQIKITDLNNFSGTVIVNIKGTNYIVYLSNGYGMLNVSNLLSGQYTVTAGAIENDKYLSSAFITSFKVSKTNSKIVANKVTFKLKAKTKKYTITLKSGKTPIKNVQVTLKIKGKKLIKAKTNTKGKATFKITKLTKKGTYKTTIKFNGNKYYKAVSKSVKIKII